MFEVLNHHGQPVFYGRVFESLTSLEEYFLKRYRGGNNVIGFDKDRMKFVLRFTDPEGRYCRLEYPVRKLSVK